MRAHAWRSRVTSKPNNQSPAVCTTKTATTNLGQGNSQYEESESTTNMPGKFRKKLIKESRPPFGPAWPMPAAANGVSASASTIAKRMKYRIGMIVTLPCTEGAVEGSQL